MKATRRQLHRWVGEIVPKIVDQVAPLRVLLFGSAVRAGNGNFNDLDFLVVVPEHERPSDVIDRLNVGVRQKPVPCDFLVATPSILTRHGKRRDSVYYEALAEGKEVYAR